MTTTIKSSAWLILGVLLAGCVSVRSPETVKFTIGGEDEESASRQGREDDRPPAQSDAPSDDDASPDDSPRRRESGKWQTAADIGSMIVGEGAEGYIFFGCDVLTTPGRDVKLAARVKAYAPDADVKGITLSFHRLEDKQCVGSARTDEDGYASIRVQPKGPGDYRFYVKVADVNEETPRALLDLPPALVLAAVRNPRTRFVVVDLDRTLAASSFFRVVLWDGGRPMPGSQRVMRRIAETYSVIYLTQRPNDLTRTSRLWLERQGYPDGVLLLGSARGLLGDAGKFKAERLRQVRKSFPNLRFGIGDKESDVQAYRDNGMKAIWIPKIKDKPRNLRNLARQMRQIHDPNVIVVENWRQINQAVFQNYRRPPDQFAKMLEARAKELRNKDDDDDDDDDDD